MFSLDETFVESLHSTKHEETMFLKDVLVEAKEHENGITNRSLVEQLEQIETDLSTLAMEMVMIRMNRDQMPFEIFEAYSELYADLVTVLFYEDGQAMRKGLEFKGDPNDAVEYRDFTTGVGLENWKPVDGVHETLLPVRTYLWEKFLKDGKLFKSDKKAEFLAAFTEILVQHIHKRVTTPELQSSTAQSRNEWLIEDLKALKF